MNLTSDFSDLLAAARDRNGNECRQIHRLLAVADRYAARAQQALELGDLALARRRLDRACNAEGEALGDCEGYGWAREALGEECPWRVVAPYQCRSALRLVLESTCPGPHTGTTGCTLHEGDPLRSPAGGTGTVHMILNDVPINLPNGTIQPPAVVCTWQGSEVPTFVWKMCIRLPAVFGTVESRNPPPLVL